MSSNNLVGKVFTDPHIRSDFRVKEWLREGTEAEVYRVEKIPKEGSNESPEEYAMKIIPPYLLDEMRARAFGRLKGEFEFQHNFADPKTVGIAEIKSLAGFEDEGHFRWYLLIELCGPSLKDLIESEQVRLTSKPPTDKENEDFKVRRKIAMCLDVIKALQGTHQLGYAHRDVKPENIIQLHYGGRLIDFGLKAKQGALEEIVGTELYMPPEVLIRYVLAQPIELATPRGKEVLGKLRAPVTTQQDIFGFGATIYHYLTTQHPFQESQDEFQELTFAKMCDPNWYKELPDRVRGHFPGMPDPLYSALTGTLKWDPQDREPLEKVAESLKKAAVVLSPKPAEKGVLGKVYDYIKSFFP